MSEPLFAFTGLEGGYGAAMVVHGVDGAVAGGEVLCVLGRNGVGKSSLLKMLHGFLPLNAGSVRFRGTDMTRLTPAARSRRGVTFCPQERIVFDDLSVRDNLMLMRPTGRIDALAPYFARFPVLRERLGQHAGTLSGGERKLLSFVRGLAEDNPLLLIDEPSEGVQHENVAHMAALIGERKAAGTAFVIVEQNLDFAARIADHYLVLDQGRVVLSGSAASLTREDIVAHLRV